MTSLQSFAMLTKADSRKQHQKDTHYIGTLQDRALDPMAGKQIQKNQLHRDSSLGQQELHNTCFSLRSFAMLTKADSRKQSQKDPYYIGLLRDRELDPMAGKQMQKSQSYQDPNLGQHELHDRFDGDCQKLVEHSKEIKSSSYTDLGKLADGKERVPPVKNQNAAQQQESRRRKKRNRCSSRARRRKKVIEIGRVTGMLHDALLSQQVSINDVLVMLLSAPPDIRSALTATFPNNQPIGGITHGLHVGLSRIALAPYKPSAGGEPLKENLSHIFRLPLSSTSQSAFTILPASQLKCEVKKEEGGFGQRSSTCVFGQTSSANSVAAGLFGNQFSLPFGAKTESFTDGSFSSLSGSVAKSGFRVFQQLPKNYSGFGSDATFGAPDVQGSSSLSAFGTKEGSISLFESGDAQTFGSLASQTGSFSSTRQASAFGASGNLFTGGGSSPPSFEGFGSDVTFGAPDVQGSSPVSAFGMTEGSFSSFESADTPTFGSLATQTGGFSSMQQRQQASAFGASRNLVGGAGHSPPSFKGQTRGFGSPR